MGPIDLGPEWLWKLFFFLGFVGLIAVVIAVVCGAVWLFRHVSFIP